MGRAASRSARLSSLQLLLYYAPRGLTVRQLAERLGVSPRTIQRDLSTIQSEIGVPVTQEGRRYGIAVTCSLPPVTLSLQEARSLLLAACLLLRYSDEADPHSISALERLAGVLPLPVADRIGRIINVLRSKPLSEQFVRVMETVTDAWAKGRLLRIRYYSRDRPELHEAVVEPYLLDASAPGYATYLIAHSRTHGQMRTFKVERIEQAEMLDEEFQIREHAWLEAALAESWGIIWTEDDEAHEVELRFSAAVAKRVREARWHRSQDLRPLPAGGCVLTLRLPSIVEVLPWIRSWGPEVEVVHPQALRQLVARETETIFHLYRETCR